MVSERDLKWRRVQKSAYREEKRRGGGEKD
jgi:hypothetical protein